MKQINLLGKSLAIAIFCATLQASAAINLEFSQVFTTGLQSSTIGSGDLDGDGDIDLAIANIFEHSVTIALNDGTGNFSDPFDVVLQNGLFHPVALAVGELDGDGLADIAIAQLQNIENTNVPFSNASFVVLYNDGGGNFTQTSKFMRGVPSSVIITDFNQDGMNDVIIGNNGELAFDLLQIYTIDSGVDIFTNLGNRSFSNVEAVDVLGSIVDEVAFDFNQDGFTDIIGINQGVPGLDSSFQLKLEETAVTLFAGTATGVRPIFDIPVAFAPWDIDSADFDGDGRTDIAVTLVGQSAADSVLNFLGREASIELYRNTGQTFSLLQSVEVLGIAYSVIVEDFDLDGDEDLAVTVQEVQQVTGGNLLVPRLKLFQNDNGVFNEIAALAVEEEPRFSIKEDFDGDGDIDFAILCTIIDSAKAENSVSGRVYIFKNNAATGVPSWDLY